MSIGNSPADTPADDDDRPSIGQALQQARTSAGLTVEEVSSTTRVRIPIVQAIEQDDFSRCGGHVYARGHIRVLASTVGLDPAELLTQYAAQYGGRPSPTPAAPLFDAERIRPEPRRPNWTAAMVAAIVAVVGFVGFTLFNGGAKSSGDSVAADSPSAKPPASPSAKAPPAKPADPKPEQSESAIAGVPANMVTVKLTAQNGQTWMSAKDHNGKLLEEGVLKQGDSKTFTDNKRIDLVLGNAGAVQLFVNGKQVKNLTDDGKVQRLSYTRGDPVAG
ncbi:helix-turn-helix domain-containing protein [Streptomyces olivoreticuli]|uniref:helix-turn-helix domain-containing protein n=1 Tax=Streptomyces olivoreticuli TaxID=68246 RepID=UPI00265AC832|nr:helix-turn-helix domain-containing protein [Streptomyces olivoreticuli]WKK25521.1 helix-turn-helix domain-containing protein [Streptomyces olivoreticuli]